MLVRDIRISIFFSIRLAHDTLALLKKANSGKPKCLLKASQIISTASLDSKLKNSIALRLPLYKIALIGSRNKWDSFCNKLAELICPSSVRSPYSTLVANNSTCLLLATSTSSKRSLTNSIVVGLRINSTVGNFKPKACSTQTINSMDISESKPNSLIVTVGSN